MDTCALMVRGVPVVFSQQVFAPVAVEVAPHAVNVIGVVLGVVVLEQKRAALHAVVVAFAFLQAAHPCEFDLVKACLADFVQPLVRLRSRLRAQVLLDESEQRALLIFAELAIGDAPVFPDGRFALVRVIARRGNADNGVGALRGDENSTSARPRSSSALSTRVPFIGPSRTSAGFAPKNCGLLPIDLPFTIVQFCEQ